MYIENKKAAILITLFLLPTLAFSDLDEPLCLILARDLENKISSIGTETIDSIFNRDHSTIDIVGEREGVHGGKIYKLSRKDGQPWGSYHRPKHYDPQGDPRWFVESVGVEAAKFFGFGIISDKFMEVPDHNEFSGAISKINNSLKSKGGDQILISYYGPAKGNASLEKYVNRYLDRFAIPYEGPHDISFHTSAIFLPPKLIHYLADRIAYQEGLAKRILEKYGNGPEEMAAAAREFAFMIRLGGTIDIDNFSASISIGLIRYLREIEKNPSASPTTFLGGAVDFSMVGRYGHELSSESDNLFIALGGQLGKQHPNQNIWESSYNKFLTVFFEEMNVFNNEFTPPYNSDFHQLRPVGNVNLYKEELCREIAKMRLIVRSTALELLAQ